MLHKKALVRHGILIVIIIVLTLYVERNSVNSLPSSVSFLGMWHRCRVNYLNDSIGKMYRKISAMSLDQALGFSLSVHQLIECRIIHFDLRGIFILSSRNSKTKLNSLPISGVV